MLYLSGRLYRIWPTYITPVDLSGPLAHVLFSAYSVQGYTCRKVDLLAKISNYTSSLGTVD